uniref:Carbohydrate ABC transporter permease n=1 Tax=Panagrellus redivivus TaxID=6233 RepID=A0A7E4UZF0_PANRE
MATTVRLSPRKMTLRALKRLQLEDEALFAQRCTGLLLTIVFIVLPVFWSRMVTAMDSTASTQTQCCDPWSEVNLL